MLRQASETYDAAEAALRAFNQPVHVQDTHWQTESSERTITRVSRNPTLARIKKGPLSEEVVGVPLEGHSGLE